MTLPIRFFKYDYNHDNEVDIIETNESDFLLCEGEITYERHTVFQNGVNQVCLTKGNGFI